MELYAVTSYAEKYTPTGVSTIYTTGYVIAPDEKNARADALRECKEHFDGYDTHQVSLTKINPHVLLTYPPTGKMYRIHIEEVSED